MTVANNIHNQVINPWTNTEKQRLRSMKGVTKEELLYAFPLRTWSAIRGMAKKLKIYKLTTRTPWNKGQSKNGNKIIREMSEKTAMTRWNNFKKTDNLILRTPKTKHRYASQKRTRHMHNDLLLQECKLLEMDGFKCIPLTKILPDAIAIKDGKVFAIELETTSPNYDKYTEQKWFDDIIWIVYRFRIRGLENK